MDQKVYDLINEQINKELFSAYLYLSFADHFQEAGLTGYANFYEIQAQEERDHAMIFRKYLQANNMSVKLMAIDQPNMAFENHMQPLEAALEHEQYITAEINKIYAAATEVNDYRTVQFLTWFIDEQAEEEETATGMIEAMRMFGSDAHALYELNKELTTRTYTVASPLASK